MKKITKCKNCGKLLSKRKISNKKLFCCRKCRREYREKNKQITVYSLRTAIRQMRNNNKYGKYIKLFISLNRKLNNMLKKKITRPELGKTNIYNKNKNYSYNGKTKCLAYDDNNIACVMCYENEEYINKKCLKVGDINVEP